MISEKMYIASPILHNQNIPSNRIRTSDLRISVILASTTVLRSTNWAIEGIRMTTMFIHYVSTKFVCLKCLHCNSRESLICLRAGINFSTENSVLLQKYFFKRNIKESLDSFKFHFQVLWIHGEVLIDFFNHWLNK